MSFFEAPSACCSPEPDQPLWLVPQMNPWPWTMSRTHGCHLRSDISQHNLPTAGSTVLLASRATCMRPTRMWAMSEVRPGWIRTTCKSQRRVNSSKCFKSVVVQMFMTRPQWGQDSKWKSLNWLVTLFWFNSWCGDYFQVCQCYLGSPVGLGHLARGGDGMSEDFSVIRDPGTTDALWCLRGNLPSVELKFPFTLLWYFSL